MKRHFRWLGPLVAVLILSAVGWLLYQKLKYFSPADFRQGLRQITLARAAAAIALTTLYYTILVGYDLLAVRCVGSRLPLAKVALASFTGYASSYNFGPFLGGASVRYRLYSLWGLSAVKIAEVVVILGLTFWVGALTLGGSLFLIDPFPLPANLHLPVTNTFALGVISLSVLAVYLGLCAARGGRPLDLAGNRVPVPSLRVGLAQAAIASADLMIGAGVLYVLIAPILDPGYWPLLSVYILSLVVGVTTQVPAGLGVFEFVTIQLLVRVDRPELVAVLVVWRAVFYLLPLAVAAILLAAHELWLWIGRGRRTA